MNPTNFGGVGVALATPFLPDLSVDYDALAQLLQFTADRGVDYYVVQGTTGEAATTTVSEKHELLRFVVDHNPRRLPVVLGIGGNDTRAVVRLMQSTPLRGVDALLCVSPYYNRPSQEGIYRHFCALADAAPVPVILYNVPTRTCSNVEATTTLRLADHPNVAAIKEACGDITQALRIAVQKPAHFQLLSGDDLMTLPMVLSGGDGVISVLANAFPELFCNMVRAALDHNVAQAQEALRVLFPLSELIYREGNPVGIKAALALRGIGRPDVRLPLVAASRALTEALAAQLDRMQLHTRPPAAAGGTAT